MHEDSLLEDWEYEELASETEIAVMADRLKRELAPYFQEPHKTIQ